MSVPFAHPNARRQHTPDVPRWQVIVSTGLTENRREGWKDPLPDHNVLDANAYNLPPGMM